MKALLVFCLILLSFSSFAEMVRLKKILVDGVDGVGYNNSSQCMSFKTSTDATINPAFDPEVCNHMKNTIEDMGLASNTKFEKPITLYFDIVQAKIVGFDDPQTKSLMMIKK